MAGGVGELQRKVKIRCQFPAERSLLIKMRRAAKVELNREKFDKTLKIIITL